jgi:hypothetical protein
MTTTTYDLRGSHIPVEKAGRILSPALWAALGDEYVRVLAQPADPVAVANAQLLGYHVDQVVEYRGEADGGAGSYRHAGAWWAESTDAEPYADLDEMARSWAVTTTWVSNQHCDHPVWSVRQNVKFRIWHDTHHITTGHGFDPDGELRVFVRQAEELLGDPHGYGPAGVDAQVDALFCESVYQLAACITLDGFPDTQTVRTPGRVGRKVLELLLEIA